MDDKFTTVDWAKGANIYEVNLRQYTEEGTFAAFEKELPRLKDMGVEILWFMPITPISKEKRLGTLGSYYACSDYTATNPEYGTVSDFKNLVSEAHKLDFKVIIDWVANHTGYDHIWTKLHPDFYKKDDYGNFYDHHGWADVIDLDFSNRDMRLILIEAMAFWIKECDIDGFRCDMAHLMPLDFWKQARTILSRLKPLFWLAECEEPGYHEAFEATYGWELLHTMEALYANRTDIWGLESVLNKYATIFPEDAMRVLFTTNHDENSHSGSEYERFGHSAKLFAVLCATWQNSMPLVYSGQELPNRKRLKFFDKDSIEWTGVYGLHDFYKALLTLHKNHPALQAGDIDIKIIRLHTTADQHIFGFVRQKDDRQVLVLLNISANDQVKFEVKDDVVNGRYKSPFSGIQINLNSENRHFELQAWEYLVYER